MSPSCRIHPLLELAAGALLLLFRLDARRHLFGIAARIETQIGIDIPQLARHCGNRGAEVLAGTAGFRLLVADSGIALRHESQQA
jgi:hypothetical protein